VHVARILLLDDEERVIRALTATLRTDGHEVISATNGRDGLRILNDEAMDLVVTDIVMPQQEGLETIAEIRRIFPDLPVIAMSGGGVGSAGEYLDLALAFGAHRTIEKPFGSAALLSAVRDLLGADRR
jgi:DNA-binding NtrC family response regulator